MLKITNTSFDVIHTAERQGGSCVMNMKWTFLVRISFCSLFLILRGGMSDKAHGSLVFCKRFTESIKYTTSKCRDGTLFERTDKNWDCICIKGSWILKTNICEDNSTLETNSRFVYGNGQINCFRAQDLRLNGDSIIYSGFLGNELQNSHRRVPVLLTSSHGVILQPNATEYGYRFDLNSFQKCNKDGVGNFKLTLFFVDPVSRWGVRRSEDPFSLCLLAPSRLTSNSYKGIFMYDITKICFMGNDEDSHVYVTIIEECEYENGSEWIDVSPKRIENTLPLEDSNSTICQACKKKIGEKVVVDNPANVEDCTPDDILDRNILEYDLDLQSSRIGVYLLNILLKSDNEGGDIRGDIDEMHFLTKAAIIAYKACAGIVPMQLYQYFLIMFRALLTESFLKYPPQRSLLPESKLWVLRALDNCFLRTTPYKLIIESECPNKFTGHHNQNELMNITLPLNFETNFKKYEVLLEFVWKLSNFLIYHCYEDFENGITYHYELRQQLEAIFSEDLLLRWSNPSNSFKMYTHLFKTYVKLDVTLRNFDECVGAAHQTSKYSEDVWLKRPIERPNGINWFREPMRRKRDVFIPSQASNRLNLLLETTHEKFQSHHQSVYCIQSLEVFLNKSNIPYEKCW